MIDGLTILNTSTSLTTGAFIVLLLFGFIGIIFITIGVANLSCGEYFSGIICIMLACCSFGICHRIVINPQYKEDYYQVTVDKDVVFEDFMNKYKIIDQEGLIYTIVERKN